MLFDLMRDYAFIFFSVYGVSSTYYYYFGDFNKFFMYALAEFGDVNSGVITDLSCCTDS
jgi:hypothetical protein